MEKLVPIEKNENLKSFVKNETSQYGAKKMGDFNKAFSGVDNFANSHPVYVFFLRVLIFIS